MRWGKRSNVEIIGEILSMRPAGKTAIMYGVNMSHEQVVMYLDFLCQKGLIETCHSNGKTEYKATETGGQLLRHIESVMKELGTD